MTDEATITLALAVVMGIAWLVRIEGKVLANERDLTRIESAFEAKMTQLLADVRYLRDRIDRALEERP